MGSSTLASTRGVLHQLRLGVEVARRRPQLDAALADGADPTGDPALLRRARQLNDPRARRAMAKALRSILEAAEEPPEAWSLGGPQPPLQREAILADRDDLVALAACLREPVPPQAAAMAALLVWDSASPLYAAGARATVEQWTATILDVATRAGGSARPRTS